MIVAGALNALDGLIAFYRAGYLRQIFIFGNLRTWSFVLLAFGVVQILAGFAVLSGRGWGRWFGIVTATAAVLIQLSVIGTYPWSAAAIIAYNVAIIYALTAKWRTRSVFAPSA